MHATGENLEAKWKKQPRPAFRSKKQIIAKTAMKEIGQITVKTKHLNHIDQSTIVDTKELGELICSLP